MQAANRAVEECIKTEAERKKRSEEAAKQAAKQAAETYHRLEEAIAEDNKEGGCSHQEQALKAYANITRIQDAPMQALQTAVMKCQQERNERAALEKAKQALEEAKQATGAPDFRVELYPAAVQLTNLGATIVVEKVLLNGRPECSWPLEEEKVVKTGDVLSIAPRCAATVSVSIETNRGTVNYKVQ